MVTLFLILPLALCGVLLALETALPLGVLSVLTHSALFYTLLSVAVMGAILAAAFRRRDSAALLSSWLFLFCGILLFSLSELVELLLPVDYVWVAEVFEASSFFPLAIAVAYAAAPLRILILPARRRAAYLLLAVVLLAAVCIVILLPWLAFRPRPAQGAVFAHSLLLFKPLLDALLVVPLAVVILVLGLRTGRNPFLLIGVGLLVALPGDILESYHLFTGRLFQEQLGHLLAIGSQLYILAGALLCALTGGRDGLPARITPRAG